MPNNVRQRIVDAVKARFQGITAANGYDTNLGQNVFVWRDTSKGAASFAENELPALNLRDSDNQLEYLSPDRFTNELDIEAEVVALAAANVDAEVRKMIRDIYTAIGVDRKWTVTGAPLAVDTLPGSDSMGVDHAGTKTGGAVVKFKIRYRTKAWKPDDLI